MSSLIMKESLKIKYNFYTPIVCEKLKEIVYHFSKPNKQELLIKEINKKANNKFESPYQTIQFLNTNDEMRLEEFDIDNYKTKNDIFEDKIHINQIICAFKIFVNFINDKRYNVLCAQFQSGKTGTSICVLFFFHSFRMLLHLLDITIEGAVIFSGLSFTSLKKQWITKLEKYKGIPTNFKNIKWGEELKDCYEKYNNYIFIHDESYRVSSKQMRVHKFYSLQQLKPSYGDDVEMYKNRNIFTLSVCATPFAEIIRNKYDNQNKKIIILQPDKKYIGLETIKISQRLKQAYKINEQTKNKLDDDIQEAFDCYTNYRSDITKCLYSNAIIRLPDHKKTKNLKIIKIIENIVKKNEWDIKFLYQKSKDNDDNYINIDYFEDAPTNDTIVIVHQKLGLGDNLEKKYISMGFEYVNYSNGLLTTKQDNMLQGLPGRFCSYYDMIHIPFLYCDIKTVNEYIELVSSKFTNFQKIPKNSQHVKVIKPSIRRKNPHYSMVIPIKNYQHLFIQNEGFRNNILRNLSPRIKVNVEDRNSIKKQIVEYLNEVKKGRFKFYNDSLNKESIVNSIIKKLENTEDLSSFRNFDSNNCDNCYRKREDLMKLFIHSKHPRNQTFEEYALNSVYFDKEDKIQICYSKKDQVLFIYCYIFDEQNHYEIHKIGQRGVTGLKGTDMFKGDLINFNNGNVCRDDDIDLELIKEDYDYTIKIIVKKLKAKTHSGYDIENPIGKFFYIREDLVDRYKKEMRKTLRKQFGSNLSVTVKMKRLSKKEKRNGYKVCKLIKIRK